LRGGAISFCHRKAKKRVSQDSRILSDPKWDGPFLFQNKRGSQDSRILSDPKWDGPFLFQNKKGSQDSRILRDPNEMALSYSRIRKDLKILES